MEYTPLKTNQILNIKSFVSMFKYTYKQNYSYKGETHNFWEFMIVLDGYAFVAVNDKIFKVNKEQVIFIKPNVFHNLQARDCPNLKVLIISFEMDLTYDLQEYIFDVSTSQISDLMIIFSQAKNVFDFHSIFVKGIKKNQENAFFYITKALELYFTNLLISPKSIHSTIDTNSAKIYSSIIKYINGNLSSKLDISIIAKHCNISISYTKKIFSLYSNMSISNYISTIKVSKAKQLLKLGTTNKEIALMLGYSDQNYFSTHFKNQTGHSPRSWLKLSL